MMKVQYFVALIVVLVGGIVFLVVSLIGTCAAHQKNATLLQIVSNHYNQEVPPQKKSTSSANMIIVYFILVNFCRSISYCLRNNRSGLFQKTPATGNKPSLRLITS